MRYYTTPTEERQRALKRHWFLKNRYLFFFPRKKLKLLDKYQRWRKIAKLLKLSKRARDRLEWIIYYYTKANENALATCRHFNIAPKVFYCWKKRFQDGQNFPGLEDKDKTPKRKRQREISPLEEERIIKLRKAHLRWSPPKLKFLYLKEYREEISCWKIQKVIEKYHLYFNEKKTAKIRRKRQRSQKKKRITELKQKRISGFLLCLDVIVIYWNGLKRYIFTAIDKYSKIALAWMYTSKSSYNARDFLYRLYYLLNGKIENVLTDNGPEFQKYFDRACQELKINHYFTRNHTPKDNPVNERFNRTLEEDFIQQGLFSPDPSICNPRLIEYCIEFDFKRAHQALGNIPPIEFAQKHLKLLPMSSYCT